MKEALAILLFAMILGTILNGYHLFRNRAKLRNNQKWGDVENRLRRRGGVL